MASTDDTTSPRFQRVILKLSGESLSHGGERGIGMEEVTHIARQVKQAADSGCEIGVVIGGGNILRGAQFTGTHVAIQEATAHYMGMLATVMNGLAVQDALEKLGVPTRVMTALLINQVAEPYIRRRAVRHLEKGRVVIFAAGTGNPYFSTDTAAALRAMEIQAAVLCKATKVHGVYTKDPVKFADATMMRRVSYDRFLQERMGVMDSTAVSLCRDNRLQIRVFALADRGNIQRVVQGEDVGTLVAEAGE
jgi:uridylate kinase